MENKEQTGGEFNYATARQQLKRYFTYFQQMAMEHPEKDAEYGAQLEKLSKLIEEMKPELSDVDPEGLWAYLGDLKQKFPDAPETKDAA